MELIEEAREEALGAARACVGCRFIGEANLADKIGEAAAYAGDLSTVQRVSANSVWRAGLAMLAREKKGSRPEQVSRRRCTWPHRGRQMPSGRCHIRQRVANHCGS